MGVPSESPPTAKLVRLAQGGDAAAFGLLYDRTIRLVRAVAADAGPDQADDVAHDAYLRAYRRLGTLRDPDRFAPWLVGIARLVVRERRRARRAEPLGADVPAPDAAAGADAEDVAELLRAIARLPGRSGWPSASSSSTSGASPRRRTSSGARVRGRMPCCRVPGPGSPAGWPNAG